MTPTGRMFADVLDPAFVFEHSCLSNFPFSFANKQMVPDCSRTGLKPFSMFIDTPALKAFATPAAIQKVLTAMAHIILSALHAVVQLTVCNFWLNHPEFCKMPGGMRIFRTKCWAATQHMLSDQHAQVT